MTAISIAMATFNGGAAYLEQQLESLAAQTLAPAELIVGDDGSADATRGIVENFARRAPFPVRLQVNGERLGYGENFIRTAERCTGEWIAFCDQDDVWLPTKLDRCAAAIGGGPSDLALVVHDAVVVDEGLRECGSLYGISGLHFLPPLALPPEWYALGATQVFRADLLRIIPSSRRVSFPWHEHREAHDVWISLLANLVGSICRTGERLILYRRHSSALTGARAAARPGWSGVFQGHGEEFRLRAQYVNDVSQLLRLAIGQADSGYRARLERAAAEFEVQARLLALRGEAYTRSKAGPRMRALMQLVAAGGYWGRAGWPFGLKRLAKDTIHASIGSSAP